MSKDMSAWTGSSTFGCIAGFAVFICGYFCTVVAIALDMRKRSEMYQELIDGDLAKLDSMGLGHRMHEFQTELAVRLAGKKDEAGVDDQLVTQALELSHEEFQKYM